MKRETEKTVQELLRELRELDLQGKNQIRKLDVDQQGNILLDRNNRFDVEWYENDENYDVVDYEKESSD
ncbi:hypothetical protein [Bacillus badius]|uniref:Uncharacterized protein n=1 Tax=Bacillus badius TaxID=1455 RepID=A0ABR5ANH5_BACBA|nr:hypothetical protein [Bacillus badius]KIL71887.1 hypothetical protein SD77_3608 [Bacillus badius]KZN99294.1 hypothetical protein A4244_19170 [Bacillus badius]KZR57169.1 hypothetical protein A3781_20215 [Bacillus badius]MED0668476.1 hypothetical protein [Bacillus badius]MED4718463.1 hypothetical protein [Bacillus badius]